MIVRFLHCLICNLLQTMLTFFSKLQATREEDVTGVWVSNKKIAACGVKLKRWVTMHGVAVNVDIRSLENFEGIVPCGLEGREVTCVNDAIDGKQYTLQEFAIHMKAALEEIFGITLLSAA